ncbi:MAG: hypothetical protein R3B72_41140 [Polyangiaceae bacterium]
MKIPHLAPLAGVDQLVFRPGDARAREVDAVLGWGFKPSSRAAEAYARRHDKPLWRAEDGFLRSVGLGVSGAPPLSIVLDDRGIYYDAREPSKLERILAEDDDLEDPELLARARRAIDRIVAEGLSKYNDAPVGPVTLGEPEVDAKGRVLVVDQTAGDLSVARGLADATSFRRMLEAALDENPGAEVVVKTHPDVLAGKKRGYLERAAGDRVRLFARPGSPMPLMREVDRVYVVTSQVGFEALMAGTEVTCFGAPWYSGWGATDDRVAVGRRGRARSVEALFAAAYLRYARYLHPTRRTAGELEDVIEHLALQRRVFALNQGRLFCLGFHFWKNSYMRHYLRCPGNEVLFPWNARDAERRGLDRDSRILVWGQRESAAVRSLAARHDIAITRVEDGFLRSVGLGSDLAVPASLVFDSRGIYYDPTGPSDLEHLLEQGRFDDEELARAKALRERIVAAGLSKYNVGRGEVFEVPAGRRVALVPGQVEGDASVRLGCRDVRTNLALIEAARAARPDAFLVYKPHPDVLAGNRPGKVEPADTARLCDHVETRASLADCLDRADEVHTMTSLVGFEALLRQKQVFAYGQPFYAGWGLTEDRHPPARRTRRLTLDELVAGAMIRYPRYLDRESGAFTTPEAVIDQLVAERAEATDRDVQIPWARRQLRKLERAVRGLLPS